MRVKVEHSGGNVSNTMIYDAETGEHLSGVTKSIITFNAEEPIPRMQLEVVNFDLMMEAEATLTVINYGKDSKPLKDLDQEQIVDALKYEALQHWIKAMHLRNAKKEIEALKETIKILELK